MTIGLAIVLSRGVVAVADGRVTNALNVADATHDNCNKLEHVHQRLLAIIGGVEMVSRRAVQEVRERNASGPREVIAAAAEGLDFGWSVLKTAHPSEYANHNHFRAAVLLAGVDEADKPYVGLVDQRKGHAMLVAGPNQKHLAFGIFSTDDAASHNVMDAVRERIQFLPPDEQVGARILAQAAAGAIGEVAGRSRTVGGIVRAAYLTATGCEELPV